MRPGPKNRPPMERLRDWIFDFSDWGLAVLRHWHPLVTGGVITGTLVVVNLSRGQSTTWLTWIWLYAAILVASFYAWREGSKGRPKFESHLMRVGFFKSPVWHRGACVLARVFLSNHGSPSSIHDLEVFAKVNGVRTQGDVSRLDRSFNLVSPFDETQGRFVDLHLALQNIHGRLFEKGQGGEYLVFAFFRDQSKDSVDVSSLELHFKDTFNKKYVAVGRGDFIDTTPWVMRPQAKPSL
jgi:hypothetical protein